MKELLIIHTHQKYEGISEGKLNETLSNVTKQLFENANWNMEQTFISNGYNLKNEVEKHLKADLVIIHTPIFWFNTPWIHKKYVDEVFMEGLVSNVMLDGDGRTRSDISKQYGTGGFLRDKKVFVVATWNAPENCFDDVSQQLMKGKNADDVLFNVILNYRFCGFQDLPNYHCFDVIKNPKVKEYVDNYKEYLKSIIDNFR
ncbi:NAD(P)H-dependent oxidoreductase [Cellulophaga baltica]|uniref:NAD(P)H-dependent oxidoreductase n=1 Tax=Cellulophaga TaxID=104264 RepID=UPI001C07BA8A|nr:MULTISPECIES: NAD(P)H-dependent oxidoreductase [Cellulophaga]MBU2994798.1 NAD(P)H-dependent oxidoreductase [Cellulophaga baltica]MDO6766193.1 NAD(P)H-dependent oxidoreductase [Cellulophaga sp. 1_MG-2023]